MSFANPLLLLGLLAAAVPVIIHLIHKRKPRQQPFPAIELLLRSVERVERRWRLRRLLLLASRVALLAALALAAAGPLLGKDRTLVGTSLGPQRLAIVVDASLSMRARYGDTSAFERAIVAARNLVDRLGPEDQATLIVARARPEALVERPTADRNRLLEVLENLEPSYEAADLGPAVTLAAESLAPIDSAQPEAAPAPPVAAKVVVLSDLQQPAIQSPAILELPGTDRQAQLEVIDVLADQAAEQRRNLAITTLESAPVPGNVPRTMELRARVQSYTKESGKEAAPKEVTLRSAEGDLETGIVEVVDGTIVDKLLRHAFERAGHHPVELVLEADALAEDSIRYAEVDVRRQVQALIVDGAPSGVPKEDEIFYLERALAAGAADQPPPRVITADDLPRADLGAFDVVILAGVPAFAPSDGARLVDWVKRGGGLFITTSKDLDPELYNSELGPILPRPFRLFRTVDPTKGGLGASGVVSLAKPLTEHPVLDLFQGEAVQGLLSARTNGYLMLQPNGQRPFTTLLEYDDGQPALVEASTGQGRVMVLTTSIDRDLSDLAIRPGFLPLMRQTLLYLGHALAKPDLRKTLVGEVRELRVPSGVTSLRVIGPDGQETEVTSLGQESELARYTETTRPGHYRVEASSGGAWEPLDSESFAVNVDTKESDLRPLPLEEAMAILQGTSNTGAPEAQSALARARALSGALSPELLVTILLTVMAVAFVLESLLTAQRLGR
ncbi:MAG: BatA domain-containing protein [Deltaproteobacteria bacterium]|nr:BatA domain-containing protein [Deltaproteobacteria bacterium]